MCDILFFILTTEFACSFSVSFKCKVVVYLRDFLFLEILLYCFKLATAFFHLATRAQSVVRLYLERQEGGW